MLISLMHSIIIPKSALKPCILTACAVHMHQHSGNGRFILWLQTTMDAGLVLCPVGHTGRSAARRFARATDPRRSIHADAFVVRTRRVSHTGIASHRPCRTPPSTLNGYGVLHGPILHTTYARCMDGKTPVLPWPHETSTGVFL